jgi:hypothetical protein
MTQDRVMRPTRGVSPVATRLGLLAAMVALAFALASCSGAPDARTAATGPPVVGGDQSLPFTGGTGNTGGAGNTGNTGIAGGPPVTAGGPPVTQAAACAQAEREAQRQLDFPPKAKMTVGETTTVEVQLAAAGGELAQEPGTSTTVIHVPTTCFVNATLEGGPQLSVHGEDPTKQSFMQGPDLEWSWLVTPEVSGTFPLHLDVQSLQADGNPQTLDSRFVDIDAVVSPESAPARAGHFINSPLGLTLLGAVLAVVLGLVVSLVTNRRRTKKNAHA